jgi:hypothetical protein
MTALIPRLRRSARLAAEEYALSPIAVPGRVRGRHVPGRVMRTVCISGMNRGSRRAGRGLGSGPAGGSAGQGQVDLGAQPAEGAAQRLPARPC